MGSGIRRIRMAALVCALACALVGASPAAAAPTARFAGPTSTLATGNCTDQSNPCTLLYAVSLSHDGDDLTILPGTYNLAGQLQTAAEVTVHGVAGSPRPLIVGKAGLAFPILFQSGGGSLKHLAFQGSPGNAYVLDLTVPVIDDIVVSATGVTNGGVLLRPGTAATTLRNSTVSVTTTSPNVAAVEARGADIRNVTAYVNGPGSIGLEAHAFGGSAITVNATNVIAHGDAKDVAAVNDGAAPGAALTVDHSAFTGAAGNTGLGNTLTVTKQVSAPALLKDPANGDFHELAGSPTIDAGVTDPANGTADPDGAPRPFGAGTDIGAYEFLPPPAVTTGPATGLTPTGATLSGTVNPNGTATTVQFVIDSGPAAPRTIAAGSLAADTIAHSVTASAGSLTAGATYAYHLHAANAGGATDGLEQTFSTPAPPKPPPPVLSNVGITKTRFAVGAAPTALAASITVSGRRAPSGTAFLYRVNEPASVTIAIARQQPGRRSGKRCVAPSGSLRHARRCTRAALVGTFQRASLAGPHRIPFSGRVGRAPLRLGNYVATITARDSLGQPSRSFRIAFTIVKRRAS